ncbi:hypothetical protein ACN1C3_21515 [Pseudomonas sp. H11T01]|uniref:hypothetical protein n=1 Tax=Pseudomonas sp. H11T01 TaxID=3402749 RepID=UPI003AC9D5D4
MREKLKPEEGAGKWVLKEIDYDGVKNTFVMLANRLGSLGDEGRMLGSDGKDYTNTTRTLIQEWLPLAEMRAIFHQGPR